jgi:hypothetical protein
MSEITVYMKNGSTKVFEDNGAPGGSYCNEKRFEPGFVVITDPYGNETAIPTADIIEIQHKTSRRNF